MSQKCGTCAAWKKTGGEMGECHLNPPQAVFMGFRPPAIAGGQPSPMIAGVFPACPASAGCRQWIGAAADLKLSDVADQDDRHPGSDTFRAGPPTPRPRRHDTFKDGDGMWRCTRCPAYADQIDNTPCKGETDAVS